MIQKFNTLKAYWREPYQVNDWLTITQPSVGQIIDFGEDKFYAMLYMFIGNTTMFRLRLWDIGIDWNKISDYQLFAMNVLNVTQQDSQILFGDIDFTRFQMRPIDIMNPNFDAAKDISEDNPLRVESFVLYDLATDHTIDEKMYNEIVYYLRHLFNIYPKVQKAKGKTTKQWIIDEERDKMRMSSNEPFKSVLLPLISSCLNHPGFKYKKSELRDVGIYEFMDSVQRIQVYEATTALLKGSYSGFVDTSKISKKEFDFMRDITVKEEASIQVDQKQKDAFNKLVNGGIVKSQTTQVTPKK